MLINKPNPKLCGGCAEDMYSKDCHCICHKQDIANGFHEIIWEEPREIKIVHPEDD